MGRNTKNKTANCRRNRVFNKQMITLKKIINYLLKIIHLLCLLEKIIKVVSGINKLFWRNNEDFF